MSTTTKTALVLGLGASGLACARFLAHTGWALRAADTRQAPPELVKLQAELPTLEFHGGELPVELLDGVSLVAISPGLSPAHSAAAPLVAAARAAGIPVVGEIELFARELQRLKNFRDYQPKLIGITGTNGKTTTTVIVGKMVEAAGRSVAVAGNIGPSALEALRHHLRQNTLPEVWVLELSSFQLETTAALACTVATVLNISDDHLDWHGSIEAYAATKAKIFAPGTIAVINRDDRRVAAMARSGAISFGFGEPRLADQYGVAIEGGINWLAWAEDLAPPTKRRKAAADLPGLPGEIYVHRFMPVDALKIRGRHNAMNALAAIALVRAIGCPLAPVLNALADYRGEAHRVQFVAQVGGVDYVDDSKGTNVGATVAALDGLGGEGRSLVVILGGEGKGQDFTPLAAPMSRHARAAILIGKDADAIAAALDGCLFPIERAATLEAAVALAASLAQPRDAVLLSPACASLDMFRHYAHRAEVFVDAVRELALESGQPC
ncbi:MAG: UDP-N-acetylmuramoyl-L-alanine--D-glutamate ligase [Burkholderiaceae bacterium]